MKHLGCFRYVIFGLILLFSNTVIEARAQPKFTLVPETSSTFTIPTNREQTIRYLVTNQTQVNRTLVMEAIPSVLQVTAGPGVCTNPFNLQHGQSCWLVLLINGGQLPAGGIHGGPKICKTQSQNNNTPDPFLCSQPSQNNVLNVTPIVAEAIISAAPATLTMVANSGVPGSITITNNATDAIAYDVAANLPASWIDVTQNANDCRAIAPNGGTCQLLFSPGETAHPSENVVINGSNTPPITVVITIEPQAGISVTPSLLELVAGDTTAQYITVTNNSTMVDARNVLATLPVDWVDVIQDASDCVSIPPNGGTCQLEFTAGDTAYHAQLVPVAGDNTTTSEVIMVVDTDLKPSLSSLVLATQGILTNASGAGQHDSKARTLSIRNIGEAEAVNVQYTVDPPLPGNATIAPGTCGNIQPGDSCILTVTPGTTSSGAPNSEPIPSKLWVTGDDTIPVAPVEIILITYANRYQGGYVFSINDNTATDKSVGLKMASFEDGAPAVWGEGGGGGAEATNHFNGWENLCAIEREAHPGSLKAIQQCHASRAEGFANWYLPAICEMGYDKNNSESDCGEHIEHPAIQNIYSNLIRSAIGNFLPMDYWSSTDGFNETDTIAWLMYAPDSTQGADYKYLTHQVRCVRDTEQNTCPP